MYELRLLLTAAADIYSRNPEIKNPEYWKALKVFFSSDTEPGRRNSLKIMGVTLAGAALACIFSVPEAGTTPSAESNKGVSKIPEDLPDIPPANVAGGGEKKVPPSPVPQRSEGWGGPYSEEELMQNPELAKWKNALDSQIKELESAGRYGPNNQYLYEPVLRDTNDISKGGGMLVSINEPVWNDETKKWDYKPYGGGLYTLAHPGSNGGKPYFGPMLDGKEDLTLMPVTKVGVISDKDSQYQGQAYVLSFGEDDLVQVSAQDIHKVLRIIGPEGKWTDVRSEVKTRPEKIEIPEVMKGSFTEIKAGLCGLVEEGGLGAVVDPVKGKEKWDNFWKAQINVFYPDADDQNSDYPIWYQGHGFNGNYWYFYNLLQGYAENPGKPTYEELQMYWKENNYFMPGKVAAKDESGNPVEFPFKLVYNGQAPGIPTWKATNEAFADGFYADGGFILAYSRDQYINDQRINEFEGNTTLGDGPQSTDPHGARILGLKLTPGNKKRLVFIAGSHYIDQSWDQPERFLGGGDGKAKEDDLKKATTYLDAYVSAILHLQHPDWDGMMVPGGKFEGNMYRDTNLSDSMFVIPVK